MYSRNPGFYDCNRLGDNLFIFHKNHKTYLNNALMEYNLNLIQALCLLRIYNGDNINQKELSDDLYLTKGAITKAIKKLEENEYICREQSCWDRRNNILKITSKGLDLIPILDAINREWESKMGFDELSEEFVETFRKLSAKSSQLNK